MHSEMVNYEYMDLYNLWKSCEFFDRFFLLKLAFIIKLAVDSVQNISR